MKNILLSACAAIALSMGASAAFADDNRYDNNGYYDNGGSSWEYQHQGYGSYSDNSRQRDWNNGGYNYRHDTVSPRSIVRSLQRNDYSSISQPVLSGQVLPGEGRQPPWSLRQAVHRPLQRPNREGEELAPIWAPRHFATTPRFEGGGLSFSGRCHLGRCRRQIRPEQFRCEVPAPFGMRISLNDCRPDAPDGFITGAANSYNIGVQ